MTKTDASQQARFSIARSLKIGTFHIGSSLTDLLTSAVWNRILIVDLGAAAWPVSLLTALRYLLAPLTLWAGHRSDTHPILGSQRLAYIWLGRLLMLVSLPFLPLSIVTIAHEMGSPLGWGLGVTSFLLYGVGTLISGAPFLALVHDSAPYQKRGQAVSIVHFMLVVSFAFIPALYAELMPSYDPALLWRLVWISTGGAAVFWFFSILGEERPAGAAPGPAVETPSLRESLRAIWADSRTRRYAVFLGVSAFFAFMQDAMLEPFGGDVFGLPVGATTRFNAYWGVGVLVGMIVTYAISRRRAPDQQVSATAWGLALLAIPLLALAAVSLLERPALVMPVLIAFGFGFGVFTVGGVSLLMAMSAEKRAGSYLALWSMIQLVTRGAGIAMGGVIRDVALALSGQHTVAYAAIFMIEGVGLLVAIALLWHVDVRGFAAAHSGGGATVLSPVTGNS
ncbi:MAG: MFS transporter [Chloroflexi bacterium HGW-Chloroflexi-1]|nr:MAG: MFS transporter [Chloroflexi bacterium HGW-Chloroflexi-1]